MLSEVMKLLVEQREVTDITTYFFVVVIVTDNASRISDETEAHAAK